MSNNWKTKNTSNGFVRSWLEHWALCALNETKWVVHNFFLCGKGVVASQLIFDPINAQINDSRQKVSDAKSQFWQLVLDFWSSVLPNALKCCCCCTYSSGNSDRGSKSLHESFRLYDKCEVGGENRKDDAVWLCKCVM